MTSLTAPHTRPIDNGLDSAAEVMYVCGNDSSINSAHGTADSSTSSKTTNRTFEIIIYPPYKSEAGDYRRKTTGTHVQTHLTAGG
ncbi:hypothetical protein BDV33DRAFT_112382 [Aspergillus novoparasiticus]|uniref:Uncharacterized protein n=1 Tax=Aspergillus novoparasiticus TaxID=986946 RepID=A0A5N6F8I6_9EURO|nr:hypothetical protein BDV33DRAFT_112382 [Aspergillus novoparasiticus]